MLKFIRKRKKKNIASVCIETACIALNFNLTYRLLKVVIQNRLSIVFVEFNIPTTKLSLYPIPE